MPADELTADEFLRMVAGETCPCGHDRKDHAEGQGRLPDMDLVEDMGACTRCGCKGLLS